MKLAQRLLILAAATALSGTTAVGQSKPDEAANAPKAKPAPAYGSGAQRKNSKENQKTPAELAALKEEKEKVHTLATVEVNLGGRDEQILIELFPNEAPKTVANFIENVKKGTYNGVAVHRAIQDYLVQTGDPASKDKNARDKWGTTQEFTIPGEFALTHTEGSVAMARRSDKVNPKHESDGTQFYMSLGNMSALDGSYSVFGKVVSGLDVVKRMSHAVTDSNDCPVARIEIKGVKISEQKGPLFTMVTTPHGNKRQTKPEALKGTLEKFLERIW